MSTAVCANPDVRLTLDQLFKEYHRDHLCQRSKKADWYNKFFNRHFGDIRGMIVDEIKPVDLQRWHTEIGRRHGHVTANRALGLFKMTYNYGDRFELIAYRRSPARSVTKFPEHARTRVASTEELKRILAAIDQIGSGNRDLFKLCLFTAARVSNVCSMRWNEIDFEKNEGTWTIPGSKSKNRKSMDIPLTTEAKEILRSRQLIYGNSQWVFPTWSRRPSKSGHVAYPNTTWQKICQIAGVEDFHIHDLRHTNATKQAELGSSMAVIGGNLGHQSVQSTSIYTQPQLPARRQAMQDAVNAMLGKTPENKSTVTEAAILESVMQKVDGLLQRILDRPSAIQISSSDGTESDNDVVTVEVTQTDQRDSKPEPDHPLKTRVAFKVFTAAWLDRHKQKWRDQTLKKHSKLLDTYILPFMGEKVVTEISKDDVERLQARIVESSPFGAAQVLSLLRRMLNDAVLMDYAYTNPLQVKADDRIRLIGLILDQVKMFRDPSMSAAVRLGFHLGIGFRGDEVTALEWEDIDLDNRQVWFTSAKGRRFSKSISFEIADMLRKLPSFGKYILVFPSPKSRGPVTRIDKAWKRACVNAGITTRLLFDMKAARRVYFENED